MFSLELSLTHATREKLLSLYYERNFLPLFTFAVSCVRNYRFDATHGAFCLYYHFPFPPSLDAAYAMSSISRCGIIPVGCVNPFFLLRLLAFFRSCVIIAFISKVSSAPKSNKQMDVFAYITLRYVAYL